MRNNKVLAAKDLVFQVQIDLGFQAVLMPKI